ncbi:MULTISPECIES: rhodanese-like domain-containing protein [unclassified Agarivorans]|uniref:rhodanese-like domain-containing protein n=1 Tax=unclassified Agarivorans TaxID=2636026 RepID=UPI0026E49219|nr:MULTISPECIES: rhodanese-like domain-containing protein [unclassified Agarivorans]MDO6687315.1 rhodanese-like domain-containing protein [Agarivorans sp. 3_MG-2023]MDO6716973.1 rhodanese-like domain-containing protein [Agarivorans sp. 2_MG-2023]
MAHNPRFLALVDDCRKRIKECDVHQVQQWLAQGLEFKLIDNREQDEWQKSRIPGAQYMGRGVLERDVETLIPNLDSMIVIYCGGGFRSALSADNLVKMGYTNVISMDGGIRGWKDANYPLEGA